MLGPNIEPALGQQRHVFTGRSDDRDSIFTLCLGAAEGDKNHLYTRLMSNLQVNNPLFWGRGTHDYMPALRK